MKTNKPGYSRNNKIATTQMTWLFILFSIFGGCLNQSSSSHQNSKPMFGEKAKSISHRLSDYRFVYNAIDRFGSRESAGRYYTNRGWVKIHEGDTATAMKRLNQAWLIYGEEPDVLWGFAAVLGTMEEFSESERMFERAISLAPKNGRLKSDYAKLLAERASRQTNLHAKNADFRRAFDLFHAAAKISPQVANIYSQWAYALLLAADEEGSKLIAAKAMSIDPNSVNPEVQKLLEQKEPTD